MTGTNVKPKVYRYKNLEALLQVSRTTIYRLTVSKELKKPGRISPGAVGWTAEYIDEWIKSRLDTSEGSSDGE